MKICIDDNDECPNAKATLNTLHSYIQLSRCLIDVNIDTVFHIEYIYVWCTSPANEKQQQQQRHQQTNQIAIDMCISFSMCIENHVDVYICGFLCLRFVSFFFISLVAFSFALAKHNYITLNSWLDCIYINVNLSVVVSEFVCDYKCLSDWNVDYIHLVAPFNW